MSKNYIIHSSNFPLSLLWAWIISSYPFFLPIISFPTDVCLWQHALPNKPLTCAISFALKATIKTVWRCLSSELKKNFYFLSPEVPKKLNQLYNFCCLVNETKNCGCMVISYLMNFVRLTEVCTWWFLYSFLGFLFWNEELISQGWLSVHGFFWPECSHTFRYEFLLLCALLTLAWKLYQNDP